MFMTLANSGSMAWLGIGIHMFLLNAVFGLVEGLVLTFAFKAKWWRAILLMIGANYFSAFAFYFVVNALADVVSPVFGITLYESAWPTLWTVVAISLPATLLLESPWVWFSFARERRSFKRFAISLPAANALTFAFLCYWYGYGSSTLYTDFDRVEPSSIVEKHHDGIPPWVYYITPDAEEVRRVRLDGTNDQSVGTSRDVGPSPRLLAWHDMNESESWILYFGDVPSAAEWSKNKYWIWRSNSTLRIPLDAAHLTVYPTEDPEGDPADSQYRIAQMGVSYGEVARIIQNPNDDWVVRSSVMAFEGLAAREKGSTQWVHAAFENALFGGDFIAQNVTQLDGGLAVVEFGSRRSLSDFDRHTILLISFTDKTVAQLAHGAWPVVVYERDEETEND